MELEVGGAIFLEIPREFADGSDVFFTGKNRLSFLPLTILTSQSLPVGWNPIFLQTALHVPNGMLILLFFAVVMLKNSQSIAIFTSYSTIMEDGTISVLFFEAHVH